MTDASVDRCLVIGTSRAECAIVRDSLRRRFARVDSLWLLRQLRGRISLASEEASGRPLGGVNLVDSYGIIVFLGYPARDENEGWASAEPVSRFAAFEWHSALQAALLVTRARVINKGVLERTNGYMPDCATAIRWMECIGWPVAVRKVSWKSGDILREAPPGADVYRLWVTQLTHVYETYGALRFPARHNVDGLILSTQDWLASEGFAGCELWLATTDEDLVITHASAGIGFLGLDANTAEMLLEGMTS